MKQTIKILIAGIFLTLLLAGCTDLFVPGDTTGGGNVTITLDAGQAGRTIRPNGITAAAAFERIELEFTKGSGDDVPFKNLTLDKGTTTYTLTLEQGIWNISARGFMKIEDREYEAAQGSTVVNVGSGSQTVGIELKTGLFDGKPGVFSYNIGFPSGITVTEAVLEINPLPDRFGYEIPITGETVDLIQNKTGSFELLPGYYLLTITAKAGATMAIWNELVHIYSGRETAAEHTFAAGNFSGTVTLSGAVFGGEFDGNLITTALITAYGDENFVNRIASVNVSGFTKVPFTSSYYYSSWSMTVPGSLTGKDVYFRVEETLGGSAGTRTQVWNNEQSVTVLEGGTPNINLNTSYIWDKWIANDHDSAVTYTVGADGTVTVITTETVGDAWQQHVRFSFPAENNVRYAYEFEAWTASGERPLWVQYIENPKYEIYLNKEYTINTTPKTFTLVSDTRFDPDVRRQLAFQVGYGETGTLFIKIKSIQPATEYVPPNVGDTPRFTATTATGGIRLKADLRGLPDEARWGLTFHEEGTGSIFNTDWIWDPRVWGAERPDFYEMLYPYVQAGKEYTFRLEYNGLVTGQIRDTATATSGRGELAFTNATELALIKEGNTIKLNKAPVLSAAFSDPNAVDGQYSYYIASGTSWDDPTAQWRYSFYDPDILEPHDLLAVLNDDTWSWIDTSGFLGKTCFAEINYAFTYNANDIYLSGQTERGYFSTAGINSAPFIYPNIIPAVFTAVPHPEGVKLTVDLTRIPALTSALRFVPLNDNGTQCWIGSYEWEWGEFYGQDTVEIIYPFVQAGKIYTFMVEFEGTGADGHATVTPTAGLGELYITNAADIGLNYSGGTKTLSLTGTPIASISFDSSPGIERVFWDWQFYKGQNWSEFEWKGAIDIDEPITSLVLDNTFDPYLAGELSNTVVFANVAYSVDYKGRVFATPVASSSSFRFPYFDPAVGTWIRTAFDTHSQLYLGYWQSGNNLGVYVDYDGSYNNSLSYTWFIDGVLQTSYTGDYANISTTRFSPGIHYGTVVVTIDGVPFDQQFTFRVGN